MYYQLSASVNSCYFYSLWIQIIWNFWGKIPASFHNSLKQNISDIKDRINVCQCYLFCFLRKKQIGEIFEKSFPLRCDKYPAQIDAILSTLQGRWCFSEYQFISFLHSFPAGGAWHAKINVIWEKAAIKYFANLSIEKAISLLKRWIDVHEMYCF